MDLAIIRAFIKINIKTNWFQNKLDRLEKNKSMRLQELKEKIPSEREAIKKKAKELYDKGTDYRMKGFDRKYRMFMNAGSVEIGKLKAISRYRKRKEIHNLNNHIQETNSILKPIRENQIKQEAIIKDLLFKEFLGDKYAK